MAAKSVLVVGAGVIGLAIAYHLLREGAQVTIVDRDPAGDKASFGNAGGIAVTDVVPAAAPGVGWKIPRWLLDPLGPLAIRPAHAPRLVGWGMRFIRSASGSELARITQALAALNGRVYEDLHPMLAATGLAGEIHQRGALSIYESEAGFRQAAGEWAAKRAYGVATQTLTRAEMLEMEPALGPIAQIGVFAPQWSNVTDPKRIVDGLRGWLLAQGATIVTGAVQTVVGGDQPSVRCADGRIFVAEALVVATGAWSATLARQLGDKVLLESERGYNRTIPQPGITLGRQLIFAERSFVASPLSCGLRIGGAAEFGGLNAVANYKRSAALVTLATLYLPGLRNEGGTDWAGHRPTTPDSLPVIGASAAHRRVVYAFGHGHLGLTQAATTGRLVADLVQDRPAPIDMAPYGITRFA
ncbi:FAD-binding oxidoreductase [Acidisphaera sp. L21]|uniref:NAD(P)/FAD-dependent oxidoreductase n=1 Tax=Acidisphaera sp. L21 TaxID=1641851 RepID=UPI00131DC2DC|nr:FAD-dependent oxidoreductase [Acidisphaera sp. L21]